MKVGRAVLRSVGYGVSRQFRRPPGATRHFSLFANSGGSGSGDRPSPDSLETEDDFNRRIFGDLAGGSSRNGAFFRKYERLHQGQSGAGLGDGENSGSWGGLPDIHDTLDDGMDDQLKRQARYFEYDSEECDEEDYTFRPDVNIQPGMTYDVKDLDLRKPGVWKPVEKQEFEVTTAEVLKKADFRNVRFLAKFITEAGIIIKRSKTGISAKAQRKIAREIKTARAFGLMPFTTMGTKHFVYGMTMQSLDKDYEHEVYDNRDDDV